MSKIILFVIMLITSLLSTVIFQVLDDRYSIRIKYFSFAAKSRLRFFIALIIWAAVLLGIIIVIDDYVGFAFLILYFTVFLSIYHKIRSWKYAYDVYIKNVDLLIKAKEKYKRKNRMIFRRRK